MNYQQTPAAFNVAEFCAAFRIGKGTFYKLLKEGKGPKLLKVGRRTLVSLEAAEAWRKKMEGTK